MSSHASSGQQILTMFRDLTARPWRDDLGQAFSKDLARAAIGGTAKAPDLDAQNNGAALAGQISQMTLVMAMDPRGCLAASWTNRGRRGWSAKDKDTTEFRQNLLDQQACRKRRQKTAKQLNPR